MNIMMKIVICVWVVLQTNIMTLSLEYAENVIEDAKMDVLMDHEHVEYKL